MDLPPDLPVLEKKRSDDELDSLSLSSNDTSVTSWDVDYNSDSNDGGIDGLLDDEANDL